MNKDTQIKIIECPRDAMQGIKVNIPTAIKIEYINLLLKAGFHTLDMGSFVSPKAVPQMADTKAVLERLALTETALLTIIANLRGAQEAVLFDQVTYLGYPLSVSGTFQKRNTNKTIDESLQELELIQSLCIKHKKELVVYLSMAFGNPYQETYSTEVVLEQAQKLADLGIKIISLADTVGNSTPTTIKKLYAESKKALPTIEWGLHLHTTKASATEKLKAVKEVGCIRIDGALGGIGGCPFAQEELVGNMPTEVILQLYQSDDNLNNHLQEAMEYSRRVFSEYL